VINKPVDQGGIGDLRRIEVLAGHGRSNDGEDAGADDGADAQGGEGPGAESLFEGLAGIFRLADQLVNGFARNELAGQGSSPLDLKLVRCGARDLLKDSGRTGR
jgi:hypothetical protein